MESANDLKAKNDIVEVIETVTNQTLKPRGVEHVGFCPFHKDGKPSLMVNRKKQIYYCGPCGNTGDVITFLVNSFPNENPKEAFKKALEYLKSKSGNISFKPVDTVKSKKTTYWQPLPTGPRTSQIVHYLHGKPNQIWEYLNEFEKVIGYVCRFDLADGTKEVLPYSYCNNGKVSQWRWRAFARPRPLYNLHLLAKYPKKNVLVVEGEKAADAAQKLFPHIVVVAWQGGSNAIKYANWEVLKNRNIILWPDNDKEQCFGEKHETPGQLKPFMLQPGNKAMGAIAEILQTICPVVKWVFNAEEFPNKWDIADADGWTTEDAVKYVRTNLGEVPTAETAPALVLVPVAKELPVEISAEVPMASKAPVESSLPVVSEGEPDVSNDGINYAAYFSFLGYEKSEDNIAHCFYVKESRIVQKFSPSKLARSSTLISLAPLDFWEAMFTTGKSKRIQTDMALNWLLRSSHQNGFFSSDSMRGRGGWMDNGRVVFHAGNHLVIDGDRTELGNLKSNYIYEAAPKLNYDVSTPMETTEANKLIQLCKLMNWSRNINAYLLAGWCVIAPVCGALRWRSHIWVTGPAGSGKSWVLKEVVRPLLGSTGLAVQAETTEAGLRQLIQSDALPVVFDEAEAEDFKQQQSIKKVLGLMRAASADDGGFLVKGTSSGTEKKYRIRSCFAFASIGITATQSSDKTRITLLTLTNIPNSEMKKERWEKLQRFHLETITPEYAVNLQARTLKMLPIILKNANVFAKAAAALLGAQRIGDQIGSLLAGAYSLSSANEISFEDAVAWIKDKDWSEEKELDSSRDENRLLQHLLERIVSVEYGKGPSVKRTVGELIGICLHRVDEPLLTDENAERALNRLGFKIHEVRMDKGKIVDKIDYVAISNNSGHIKKMLYNTPWQFNWNKVLNRVDGAIETEPVRFTVSATARAVGIPLNFILGVKETPVDKLPF